MEIFITRKEGNRNITVLVFVVYALTVLLSVPFHEPWRDEAQVWLLGRDNSIGSLFRELSYDGSPPLWHIMVMALARSGLPYMSMGFLHAMLAVATAAIILRYSPFSLLFNTLILFSYYFLYEYALIARSYGLSVMLIFALTALFQKRYEKPLLFGLLVALLCNTNTHSIAPSAAFGALYLFGFLKEWKTLGQTSRHITAMVIMIAGALLAFFILIPPSDSWKPGFRNEFSYLAPVDGISDAFLPTFLTNPGMTLFFKHWTEYIFFGTFMLLAIISLGKKPEALFWFLVSFLGLSLILTFKHSGYIRHYGFYLIYLIAALWMVQSSKTQHEPGRVGPLKGFVFGFLALSLFTSVFTGAYYLVQDWKYAFSGSREMAAYIREKGLQDKIMAGYNVHGNIALYPYLPGMKLWDPGLGTSFTFIHWDKQYLPTRGLKEEEILRRIFERAGRQTAYYILMNKPLEFAGQFGLVLEKEVSEGITGDEYYYLYHKSP